MSMNHGSHVTGLPCGIVSPASSKDVHRPISAGELVNSLTIKILSIGLRSFDQTALTQIRLLLILTPKVCLVRADTVCHSIIWMHYCIVSPNCSIFKAITVLILGDYFL